MSDDATLYELIRETLRKRVDGLIEAAASGDLDDTELQRELLMSALVSTAAMAYETGMSHGLLNSTWKARLQ